MQPDKQSLAHSRTLAPLLIEQEWQRNKCHNEYGLMRLLDLAQLVLCHNWILHSNKRFILANATRALTSLDAMTNS